MKPNEPPTPETASDPEELLDQEQSRAIQDLQDAVSGLWNWGVAGTGLRSRVRKHPGASVGLGAVAGFVSGPAVVRTLIGGIRPGSRVLRLLVLGGLRHLARNRG